MSTEAKKALIFGITGQDGSYLSELLLRPEFNYEVYGVKRRSSSSNVSRVAHLLWHPNFDVLVGDVTDFSSVARMISDIKPDEVYNLAAQSHVKVSFDQPIDTSNSTYLGALNILEAIRQFSPKTRMYQASSSEMFGTSYSQMVECDSCASLSHVEHFDYRKCPDYDDKSFQNESTPMLPCSPYAVAKLAAHNLCRVYRDSYGLFISSGILFNHESPRRPVEFVTRKITDYVAKLKSHIAVTKLKLGNVSACRDWGYAGDYVEAMWLMLQRKDPDDFVIATGETHSVSELVEVAFAAAGYCPQQAWEMIEIDESLNRPCEVPMLKGDASKAANTLGWKPQTSFNQLIEQMVSHDINYYRR